MINFYNKKCSYCKELFKDDTDIVVCPKCGNAYHRKCYDKKGYCDHIKEDSASDKNDNHNTQNMKSCPKCGHNNSENAIFCEKCGTEFSQFNNNPFGTNAKPDFQSPIFVNTINNIDENSTIDNIKVKDITNFVGVNFPYYLFVFNRLKNFNINKFNFSAFLFSGGWLLYRKKYLLGSIITILILLCYIIPLYIEYYYYNDIMKDLSNISGINFFSIFINNQEISSNEIYNAFYQLEPIKKILFVLPSTIFIVRLIIMFIIGFNANKIYFKHVKSQIKKIKSESKNEKEYTETLKSKGGVNTPLGICLAICYIIINCLPQFLIK